MKEKPGDEETEEPRKEELEGQESMQEELCDLVKHALVPVKQVLEDYGRRSWRTMAA